MTPRAITPRGLTPRGGVSPKDPAACNTSGVSGSDSAGGVGGMRGAGGVGWASGMGGVGSLSGKMFCPRVPLKPRPGNTHEGQGERTGYFSIVEGDGSRRTVREIVRTWGLHFMGP